MKPYLSGNRIRRDATNIPELEVLQKPVEDDYTDAYRAGKEGKCWTRYYTCPVSIFKLVNMFWKEHHTIFMLIFANQRYKQNQKPKSKTNLNQTFSCSNYANVYLFLNNINKEILNYILFWFLLYMTSINLISGDIINATSLLIFKNKANKARHMSGCSIERKANDEVECLTFHKC